MRAQTQTNGAAIAVSSPPRSVPPKLKRGTATLGLFAGVVSAFALLGGGAVLYFFNPSTHGFYPVCLFHELTGLNCPGCGGTRAAYALLHGRWETALKDNALFVLLLPAVALRGAWFGIRKFQGRPTGPLVPVNGLWALLAAAVVFAVLRNLPAFAFLSPN